MVGGSEWARQVKTRIQISSQQGYNANTSFFQAPNSPTGTTGTALLALLALPSVLCVLLGWCRLLSLWAVQVLRSIVREEGVRGLYRGWGVPTAATSAQMLRVVFR